MYSADAHSGPYPLPPSPASGRGGTTRARLCQLRLAFITVGDTRRLTGGYLYHREVFGRLRARGIVVDEIIASAAGLDEQLAAAEAFGRTFDPAPYDAVVVDALARAVCAPWLDAWRARRPLVAMVHELPSVAVGDDRRQTTDDRPSAAVAYAQAEELAREAPLLRADRLIAVSDDGARILATRGVDPARIVVASGGLDRLRLVVLAGSPCLVLTKRRRTKDDGRIGRYFRLWSFVLRPQLATYFRKAVLVLRPGHRDGYAALRKDAARCVPTTPTAHLCSDAVLARQQAPIPASSASVLCVAQWIPRKGVLELARAWARAARPGWRLELVGEDGADPAYAAEVRAALAAAPTGSVVVRGPVGDAELATAYARAALFAMPSRYEGYGIAFAEALFFGLPVVGCAAGPVPALVGPDAGLLVSPGDADALAAALACLMDDGALRERLAAAARARAAELPTWDACADAFLAAIQAALGEPEGPGPSGPPQTAPAAQTASVTPPPR